MDGKRCDAKAKHKRKIIFLFRLILRLSVDVIIILSASKNLFLSLARHAVAESHIHALINSEIHSKHNDVLQHAVVHLSCDDSVELVAGPQNFHISMRECRRSFSYDLRDFDDFCTNHICCNVCTHIC